MRMTAAIDAFLEDARAEGRINTAVSERSYRDVLMWHAEDVGNRDPRYTNPEDVKRTLARWSHPNTRAKRRSYLISFYRYLMEEGLRKDNPVEQTRRPKRRPVNVYRMTLEESVRLLAAAETTYENRTVFLGICAGLRNQEMRGLQGRHFQRAGWVWVSEDIAKGNRYRWVPVISDLEPTVDEIRRNVGLDEYVFPAARVADPGFNRRWMFDSSRPCSPQYLRSIVVRLGQRAGIAAPIYPHLMRHAFTDHVSRYAGMRNAQMMLGHASISTTEGYLGKPTLDELAASVRGLSFASVGERLFQGVTRQAAFAGAPPGGLEPPTSAARSLERILTELYPRFREVATRG